MPESPASCFLLGKFAEDRVHPGRGESQVLEQFPTLVSRKRPLQVIAPFSRDVLLAQLAESLDKQPAQPASRLHVAWRCAAELDGSRANLDRPGWAVGEKHRLCRNLLREAQDIRGIGPGRLEAGTVAAGQRSCHRLGGRCK